MAPTRRTFTAEQKRHGIAVAKVHGVTRGAQMLHLHHSTLARWVQYADRIRTMPSAIVRGPRSRQAQDESESNNMSVSDRHSDGGRVRPLLGLAEGYRVIPEHESIAFIQQMVQDRRRELASLFSLNFEAVPDFDHHPCIWDDL